MQCFDYMLWLHTKNIFTLVSTLIIFLKHTETADFETKDLWPVSPTYTWQLSFMQNLQLQVSQTAFILPTMHH